MEFKEIQLEDVVCRSDKCVPLKDALGQPGPGTAAPLPPRLSWWGRRDLGCWERDREGALLLEVSPLQGVNKDAFRSHPQAGEGAGRRGGRPETGAAGWREEGSCACVHVHSRGEEESGEQTQKKGQAKRRLPL